MFALCALLGFQFAPRIPDLKSRRLYSFSKPSSYPTLEPLIGGRINVALIRAHWDDILRVAASIRTGTVTASLIMRQLASYPRQNGVAAALRELGRMERTLFIYVTWNQISSGVARFAGESSRCIIAGALASPGHRATRARVVGDAGRSRHRPEHAQRLCLGPCRIPSVWRSGLESICSRLGASISPASSAT